LARDASGVGRKGGCEGSVWEIRFKRLLI
jgi:hypothetical protein